MSTAPNATTTVEDADGVLVKEDDAVGGDESDPINDDGVEAALFEVMLAPVVHLDLSLDDTIDSKDVAATISCAVDGLMEALLPQIFLTTESISNAPNITFPRDREPVPTPFDRHGVKRAPKKTRQKKSSLKSTMYGGPTSRAPSRASSRAASRFGGSTRAPSIMRSAVMATKLAQLTRSSADPFHIVPWHDGASSRLETPGVGAHWGDGNDGTAPLAGSTARRRVDVAEIQRRGEIERDISTREARRQLTQQIQRRGELPLKLRSLADPAVSFDKQEVLAAAAARNGAASRLGSSRIGGMRPKTPAMSLPLSSLAKSVSRSSGFSIELIPALDEGDPSATFRSEDYRDISSNVVLLGKGGEVLVGDNCYLVARKPRGEIAQDLSRKATVEPRISLFGPQSDAEASVTAVESPCGPQEIAPRSVGKAPLPALSVKKSSSQLKLVSMFENEQPPVSPAFEGRMGSFDTYPRLEMDPSKTPLAKGVTFKRDEASVPATAGSPKRRNTRSIDKLPSPVRPQKFASIDVNAAPSELDPTSLNAAVPGLEIAPPAAEKPSKASSLERSTGAPRRAATQNNGAAHLYSLRTRTPAQERRPPASKQSRNRFNLTELEEAAIAESMEHDTAVESTGGSPALPRVKYMREFPIPPPGTIHIFNEPVSIRTSEAAGIFPFKALPSIVKAKR